MHAAMILVSANYIRIFDISLAQRKKEIKSVLLFFLPVRYFKITKKYGQKKLHLSRSRGRSFFSRRVLLASENWYILLSFSNPWVRIKVTGDQVLEEVFEHNLLTVPKDDVSAFPYIFKRERAFAWSNVNAHWLDKNANVRSLDKTHTCIRMIKRERALAQ